MNEVFLVVMITVLAVANALLGWYYVATQKSLLNARVQYRTECIHRESADEQLAVTTRRLGYVQLTLDQHREMVRHLMDRRFQLECELQLAHRGGRPALDDQTKALVRLATSNPNEHEKHAAAMLVCKRLREKIDA